MLFWQIQWFETLINMLLPRRLAAFLRGLLAITSSHRQGGGGGGGYLVDHVSISSHEMTHRERPLTFLSAFTLMPALVNSVTSAMSSCPVRSTRFRFPMWAR